MLKTEMQNPATRHLDKMKTEELVTVLHTQSLRAFDAVGEILPDIARAVDKIADAFSHGGRLFYVGCGTSGRLGVADAAECPPTFGIPASQVVGIIAGGESSLAHASEGAEDSYEDGERDLGACQPTAADVVVAISAAGGARYCLGALAAAKRAGAYTVALTSNAGTPITAAADLSLVTDTGAEALTGSTRMKAGTAQKLVLNLLSTGAMVRTGKVYDNYMINVKPSNEKLRARCLRILGALTGAPEENCRPALDGADGDIRRAAEILHAAGFRHEED